MEEELKERLFKNTKTGWNTMSEEEKQAVYSFSQGYMDFLNRAKTEREFISEAKKQAETRGFKDILQYENLNAGDKVYYINRDKSMYLAIIGERSIEEGINIVGAHVDSPRLDLKPNPLYENGGLAYFKTHYYGGIKKYQWTTIPLSIHGVIVKADGEKLYVNID